MPGSSAGYEYFFYKGRARSLNFLGLAGSKVYRSINQRSKKRGRERGKGDGKGNDRR